MKSLEYDGRLVVLTEEEVAVLERLRDRAALTQVPEKERKHLVGLGFICECFSFGFAGCTEYDRRIPTGDATLTAEGENFLRVRDMLGWRSDGSDDSVALAAKPLREWTPAEIAAVMPRGKIRAWREDGTQLAVVGSEDPEVGENRFVLAFSGRLKIADAADSKSTQCVRVGETLNLAIIYLTHTVVWRRMLV